MNLESLHIKNLWGTFEQYKKNKLRGCETGLKCLDRLILGLHGTMTIQGGTGCNKSTLALQIAVHHATKTGPVLFFDRENGINRILERLACQLTPCSAMQLQTGAVDITQTREFINKRPFHVFTDGNLEMLDLVIGQCREKWPERTTLLVVDSLQALPIIADKENISIGNWMNGLDSLKLKYDPHLVMIVTSEKTKGGYDSVSEVAGYGSNKIGYKSELVLDMANNKETGQLVCTISKDRDGPANCSINLQRQMVDPMNPRSFSYKLEEAMDLV